MTPRAYYTSLFYTWEYRGRGWHLADHPISLEAPFIPYYRHGYPPKPIDDGKRHTVISRFIEQLRTKAAAIPEPQPLLPYDTLEPFYSNDASCLKGLQVIIPKERKITPEKMNACLTMLMYINATLSFEIIGTAKEIIIQFVVDEVCIDVLKTYLQAFFPTFSFIPSSLYIDSIIREDNAIAIVDFGLRDEFFRPLHTPKNFALDPLIGILSVFEQLHGDDSAGMQVLFQPTVNQWSDSILRSVTMHDGNSFFIDAPDAPQLAHAKVKSPLYGVTIRAFGQAKELPDAFSLLERISFALQQGTKGQFNELIPLSDEAYTAETRINDIILRESHRLGMILNLDELLTLVHFPSETITSKKLFTSIRKTKAVPHIAQDKEFIVGYNIHDGIQTNVTVDRVERTKHMHVIGATGTGKSTLLTNLVLQDIQKGIGIVLFDPHGDLVDAVIARLPAARVADVVLIDPSDSEYPIGINILEAHSDTEKDVLASDLVAIFKRYATSWGDQMNTIIANALLAILESTKGGTLHDLRRFLLEKEYRDNILRSVRDPAVIYYWQKEYPVLKSNSLGPILTRLNTFLRPKAIRNILIQKKGLDFDALLQGNKIILFKLSQGLIGIENSFLLGSLILSKLHLTILRRQQHSERNPIFIYLDEFQHFSTPSMKDMIGGIRKYNVGLILAHQDLQQLQREDGELLNSVLGNCYTRIVFRVGEPDAKKLHDGFSGFNEADVQNLAKGEAVMRIEQPQYDCSLDTVRAADVDVEHAANITEHVIAIARNKYATPRNTVEASFFESFESEKTTEKESVHIPQKDSPKPSSTIQHTTRQPVPGETSEPVEKKDTTRHRYLQTLVKKMAEARGYIATVEMPVPTGTGHVDVLLAKDGKTVAVEICHTTDPEWELHNIQKCIDAGYTYVVSLAENTTQVDKIQKYCLEHDPNLKRASVLFQTPDAFFSFLDKSATATIPEEVNMKGYRINVSYGSVTADEMDKKRASVTQVIVNTLRKQKRTKQ